MVKTNPYNPAQPQNNLSSTDETLYLMAITATYNVQPTATKQMPPRMKLPLKEHDFVQLITENQSIIRKICHLYERNAVAREDLYQEVVLQAWKSVGNFKGDSKFSTWLYRVALNTSITYIRKEKKRVEIDTLSEPALQLAAEVPDEEKEYQMRQMFTAIDQLSKIDKALVMLYIDELPYDEISTILGITPNHVAVKLNRIKTRLKKKLNA